MAHAGSGRTSQIAVIINSYNRRDLLVQAMESLVAAFGTSGLEYAVVVFEAGSTDGSREWLTQFQSQHRDVQIDIVAPAEGEDSSFAEGVNRGCQYALETFPQAEFLFLYETDNWLASAAPVAAAMELLREQPRLAAAGFTVRRHSGESCGWGEPFPTVLSFVLGLQLCGFLKFPRAQSTIMSSRGLRWFCADVVYTSPLAVKAAVWRELGGMDAELFPYSDSDLEWEWKAVKAGYRCGVVLTDEVVHDNGGTVSNWSSMRVLKFHQARFRLLRKHRGPLVALAIPALFLRHLAEYLVLSVMVLAGRRPRLSLKKRSILLRSVWTGYESAG